MAHEMGKRKGRVIKDVIVLAEKAGELRPQMIILNK